jgi:lipopolysaccharide/colanic/teichoic acid biosynthesis glycosyltransferase
MQEGTLPPYPPDQASLLPGAGYLSVKRGTDVILSAALLIVSAPIILMCAGLIRVATFGPAFYSQARLGRFGRPFLIWKLHTTSDDGDNGVTTRRAIRDDPRVSSIGRILRFTHLDELPQLWNVLKGDISLVGPRPERPEFIPILETAIPNYRQRLAVRPGMTGLAQVCLPRDTGIPSVRKKLRYDRYYIRAIGPLLDLRLLIASALVSLGLPREIVRQLALLPHPSQVQDLPPGSVAAAPAYLETAIESRVEPVA